MLTNEKNHLCEMEGNHLLEYGSFERNLLES